MQCYIHYKHLAA